MFQGISLEQAPPFSLPIRFFLSAPLFLILAGFLMLVGEHEALQSRWSWQSIALVHALTVGFGALVMLGALTQMLPVLAGVRLSSPLKSGGIAHTLLFFGALVMVAGFWLEIAPLLLISSTMLGLGFLIFLLMLGREMFFNVSFVNSTIRAMQYSIIALLVVIFSGIFMLVCHGLGVSFPFSLSILDLHVKSASFGWTLLLVTGVSFQVVPMFYVTHEYPLWLREHGVKVFAVTLMLLLAIVLSDGESSTFPWLGFFIVCMMCAMVALWCFFTLKRISSRKRALSDPTIRYWQISSMVLLVFSVILPVSFFAEIELHIPLFVLFGIGFGVSLISGMLYKIIPFLVWFHLSGAGVFAIPSMREMISERLMNIQTIFHLCAFFALLFTPIESRLFCIAGVGLVASNVLLLYNLYKATRIYYENISKAMKFEGMEAYGVAKN
ncbi:MAG: hypothetical protein ACTTJS_04475 [Wolinella sp.]